MTIQATRYHDISCGHRVVGHEGKCRNLHGHNYRIFFTVQASKGTDELGRVMDFSVIKEKLCVWLEANWDHKMLLWHEDPLLGPIAEIDREGVVAVPFNPTAENIAQYLLHLGNALLHGTGVMLMSVTVEETRKCSATVEA